MGSDNRRDEVLQMPTLLLETQPGPKRKKEKIPFMNA